jgi:hypothetical protein
MSTIEDRLARLILVLVPSIIVTLGCGVSLLPRDMVMQAINALTAWLTLSLLIGVVVGHCALGEAENP